MNGRLTRFGGGSGILDAARCHGCGHLARIHNVVGCVSGPCECAVTRAELMPDAPRLEVPDGIESTPAAPPAESTAPPVVAAPTPAAAPAAPAPVRAEAAEPAADRVVAPVAATSRSVPTVASVAPLDDLPAWDPPKLPPVRPMPAPFDFGPFLARALWVSSRWYCPACHNWPLDPGACAVCRRPLQAVYNVTIPREITP